MIVVFIIANHTNVYADMGPKEGLQIEITGIETEYYVAILSKYGTGLWRVVTAEEVEAEELKILASYQDKDGYKCLEEYWTSVGDLEVECTYNPPNEFKILIYDVENDKYIVSEKCERYAFNSYFYVTVEDDELTIEKGSSIFTVYTISKVMEFIARLITTVYIEIFIAELFLYKEKQAKKVLIISNTITQILLNVILFLSHPIIVMFLYPFLEIFIFIIEAIIYCFTLYKYDMKSDSVVKKRVRACGYSLIANAFSYLFGVIIYYIGAVFAYSGV